MGKIQQEFGDRGVSVVAINTAPFSSLEEWKRFWRSKKAADVIWATDLDQELVRLFRVYSLGTTIIIDRQGRISYKDGGATPYSTLLSQVEPLL